MTPARQREAARRVCPSALYPPGCCQHWQHLQTQLAVSCCGNVPSSFLAAHPMPASQGALTGKTARSMVHPTLQVAASIVAPPDVHSRVIEACRAAEWDVPQSMWDSLQQPRLVCLPCKHTRRAVALRCCMCPRCCMCMGQPARTCEVEANIALAVWLAGGRAGWAALDEFVHHTVTPPALLPICQAPRCIALRPHADRHADDSQGQRQPSRR